MTQIGTWSAEKTASVYPIGTSSAIASSIWIAHQIENGIQTKTRTTNANLKVNEKTTETWTASENHSAMPTPTGTATVNSKSMVTATTTASYLENGMLTENPMATAT